METVRFDPNFQKFWPHRSWWQVNVGDNFWDVGDFISILVTSFGCKCPTPMQKDRGRWLQKRPKVSPTSQRSRQHISSPTSVTNNDVAKILVDSKIWVTQKFEISTREFEKSWKLRLGWCDKNVYRSWNKCAVSGKCYTTCSDGNCYEEVKNSSEEIKVT